MRFIYVLFFFIGSIYKKFSGKICNWLYSAHVKGMFLMKKIEFDAPTLYVLGFPRITIKSNKVFIGKEFRLNSYPYGIGNNYGSKITVCENANLHIGNNSGISNAIIYCYKEIFIGDHVNIGDGTMICDTDFHSINWQDKREGLDVKKQKASSVHIGNYVFIGARSIVLKGVTIGDKSVIGAGSVVAKDIPEGEIWAGNPIRFIRKI